MHVSRGLIGCLIGLLALAGCGKPQAAETAQRPPDGPPPPAPDYDREKALVALADVPPEISAPPSPAAAADTEGQERIDRVLSEAREQFDQRLYTSAILTLEKGLRRHATHPEIHRLLGAVCFHQGSTGRAKSHLERAIELDGNDVMSQALLGKIAEQTGELQSALVRYRTALLCADNDRPVYRILATMWLAAALEGEGYFTASIEAWTAYEMAHSSAPEATRRDLERWASEAAAPETSFVHTAELHARLGHYDPATEAMSKAILATTDLKRGTELQARYAELAARAGREDEALATAKRLLDGLAVRNDVDAAAVRESFAGIKGIYDAVGRTDRLIGDLRAAIEANPNPALLAMLADEQIAAGRTEDAEQTLRDLLAAHPDDRDTSWRLAELQAGAGNSLGALLTLADAIAMDPADATAAGDRAADLMGDTNLSSVAADALARRPEDGALRYLLGQLAANAGDSQKAGAHYLDAITASPAFQPAYVALGEARIASFEWTAALEVAQKAVAAGLDGAAIQRLVARAYDGLDEIEKAEKAYLAAIDANPQDADSMVDLANMWVRVGDQARMAQRQYESAIAVDPTQTEAYLALLRRYLLGADQADDPDDRVQLATDLVDRMRRHVGSTAAYERAQALLDFIVARRQNPFAADLVERYIAALEAVAEKHPDDVGALRELTEIHESRSDYDLAETTIRRALQRDSRDVDCREMLFRSLHRSLKQDEAAQVLQGLIDDFPRRAFYWERLAAMHLIEQEWEPAISLLARLVDEPFMADIRQRLQAELVNTLDLAGRSDEAVAVAREIYDADPSDLAARLLLASILQAAERDDALMELAESEYAKAPTDPAARALLVDACMAADKSELALARVVQWLEEDPEEPAMNGMLFNALVQADAHDAAIELAESYRAGVEGDDGFTLVRALLAADRDNDAIEVGREWSRKRSEGFAQEWYASLLIQAGRYGDAEKFLRQLADAQRSYDARKTFLLRLSYCYQQMDELEAAEKALTEIYELNPNDVEICNDLGYTWTDAGKNLDQAERMIRRALASRPRNAAYLDSLGWVRYKRGDFAEARVWLQRATQARPIVQAGGDIWVVDASERGPGDDPILYDHLGDAAYQTGDTQAALAAWRTAVKLHEERDDDDARDDTQVIAAVREKIAAVEAGSVPAVAEVVGEQAAESEESK